MFLTQNPPNVGSSNSPIHWLTEIGFSFVEVGFFSPSHWVAWNSWTLQTIFAWKMKRENHTFEHLWAIIEPAFYEVDFGMTSPDVNSVNLVWWRCLRIGHWTPKKIQKPGLWSHPCWGFSGDVIFEIFFKWTYFPPLTCQVHRALDAGAEGSGIFFGCFDQTKVVGCWT